MQPNRDDFLKLLSSLGSKVANMRDKRECQYCVYLCLKACDDIQKRAPGFIPDDLVGILRNLRDWDMTQGAIAASVHSQH